VDGSSDLAGDGEVDRFLQVLAGADDAAADGVAVKNGVENGQVEAAGG